MGYKNGCTKKGTHRGASLHQVVVSASGSGEASGNDSGNRADDQDGDQGDDYIRGIDQHGIGMHRKRAGISLQTDQAVFLLQQTEQQTEEESGEPSGGGDEYALPAEHGGHPAARHPQGL